VKDGLIYNLREEGLRATIPVTSEITGDYHVLLSDDYFFYTRVGRLNVKKRKIRAVAENYLAAIFPMDLLGGFVLFDNKGVYTALIYKPEFAELAESLSGFLNRAKKISTAFCELSVNYEDFVFKTRERFYESKGETLTVIASAENAATAEDCFYSLKGLKCDLDIPFTDRGKNNLKAHYKLLIAVAAAFLLFLGGNILNLADAKKTEQALSEELERLYTAAGVAAETDPYGTLVKLSNTQNQSSLSPLNTLSTASEAAKDITFEIFSINERLVRIEGKAENFAAVDDLVKNLEKSLQKQINLEDTRQNGDKVVFTARYTP
jgi:hypothetical protein